jgi:hypothetical protein
MGSPCDSLLCRVKVTPDCALCGCPLTCAISLITFGTHRFIDKLVGRAVRVLDEDLCPSVILDQ